MASAPEIRVKIWPGALIGLAVLVLMVPLNWLTAFLIAATVHEFFHIAATLLLGGRIRRITIGTEGARIEGDPMTVPRNLVCILAGPLGALLLLALGRPFPRLALCALVQSAYNLLPVYPLDGGSALACAASFLPGKWKERIPAAMQAICFAAVFAAGVWGSLFLGLGLLPLLPAFALTIRICREKYLANPRFGRYNSPSI